MEPTQENNKFPVFEANQILYDSSLNQLFNYLGEQERLTRANLIGIGIVCGLEISLEEATIHLSRGCGVTSEGYLIVEPNDLDLVAYRDYELPSDQDYPRFKDPSEEGKSYPLWELLPAEEPDTKLLANPADFLQDKAVLLFLELKKAALRNCSPNECSDRGSEVTATVRRLLVRLADLKRIIGVGHALDKKLTFSDLEKALSLRRTLPILRLPRYDAPNTNPASTKDVLAAFLTVFQTHHLAAKTGEALSAAYRAFRPLLQKTYPADPFAGFEAHFDFLDAPAKLKPEQVRFLQYYYDFFDDLGKAYDEIRRQGEYLLCTCCPPSALFPRHLMLGAVSSATGANPDIFRQRFQPSPALCGCEEGIQELLQLFSRLVTMIARFTHAPPLPKPSGHSAVDEQIRITPSTLSEAPLSERAIPYYYLQKNGTPPLYQIWNYDKSRHHRANYNLGYRHDEYAPPAPPFVSDPLCYDLEPYNFLRIEGHLGKDYLDVLKTLLFYKKEYRLPIDIIALRTGPLDDTMPVKLSEWACWFEDLDTLYAVVLEELFCSGDAALVAFAKALPPDLSDFASPEFHTKYEAIFAKLFANWKAFALKLNFPCKLEPLKTILKEYERRLRIVRQKRVLSYFLNNHPGIQHKAGVPLGGTFIIVYHEESKQAAADIDKVFVDFTKMETGSGTSGTKKAKASPAADLLKRISAKPELLASPEIRSLVGMLSGKIPFQPAPSRGRTVDRILQETVDKLEDGTVIADFFLPYLCCSDCAPIQYVLPAAPLGLSVKLDCTDLEGFAVATLTPKGGTGPFFYKVDDKGYQELTGQPVLPAGDHTVTLRDSAGVESVPYPLTVPPRLAIGPESYKENAAKGTYQVIFSITGGTPPYQADSGTIELADNIYRFTSDPNSSGELFTVKITDHAKCPITKKFEHTVCTWPCEGRSRRCAYRLWLQPPVAEAPYKGYQPPKKIKFQFNGEVIDIPDANKPLDIAAAKLNSDFHTAVGDAVKALNKAINAALTNKFGPKLGKNRLVLSYEPPNDDLFAILWIESFVCETFGIEFAFSYANPAPRFNLTVNYVKEEESLNRVAFSGTVISHLNRKVKIPAFDCRERNQCTGSGYQKLCKGPKPKIDKLTIKSKRDRFQFTGQVSNLPPEEIVAWIWDVPLAQAPEPLYAGTPVVAQLKEPAGQVRLTVITKNGCFSVEQKNIEQ